MAGLRLKEPDMAPTMEWVVEYPVIQKVMLGAYYCEIGHQISFWWILNLIFKGHQILF